MCAEIIIIYDKDSPTQLIAADVHYYHARTMAVSLPRTISSKSHYTKGSIILLCRAFRTYPRIMSRKVQLPPFVHDAQMLRVKVRLPLAICFALSRMLTDLADTGFFSDIVQTTIGAEMDGLFIEVSEYPMVMLKIETADAKHPVSHLWPRNLDGSF